jgi:uncharacterized protein YjiK
VSGLAVASKTYQTTVNKSQMAAKQVKFRISRSNKCQFEKVAPTKPSHNALFFKEKQP